MNNLSPARRKVVVLCASVAAMSGSIPVLTKGHPRVAGLMLGLMCGMLIVAIAQFARLRRKGEL